MKVSIVDCILQGLFMFIGVLVSFITIIISSIEGSIGLLVVDITYLFAFIMVCKILFK